MIETYLLEQLAAVDECGTLSAASEKLHLTQPSISRSMQKLEELFGVPLFERSKNKLRLNANGRLAAECARHILIEEEDMVSRVRALDRSTRTIAVGCISPGPMMELSPLLSSLYPERTISVEIRKEDELIRNLHQGIIQMMILNRRLEEEDFACHPCGSERLYFVVPPDHRIAKQKDASFSDMNGETFLMVQEVGYWDEIVKAHLPDSRILRQDSFESMAVLIQSSSLPFFATDLTIRIGPQDDAHAYIPIRGDAAVERYYCYCRKEEEQKYLAWCQALERRFSLSE